MRKNFTLIELLVVVAIIAILAGLIMPALGHAQARGKTTECLNNKRQLMTAMRMYASDNESMMFYRGYVKVDGADTLLNYAQLLSGYDGKLKAQITAKVLVCNTANTKTLKTSGENAVGMIDVDFKSKGDESWYDKNKKDVGRFLVKNDKNIAYSLEKLKRPTETVIFADSYKYNSEDDSSEPFWSFVPDKRETKYCQTESAVTSAVTLIHGGSETTVAYADGRAEAADKGKLRGAQNSAKDAYLGITKFYDSNFENAEL